MTRQGPTAASPHATVTISQDDELRLNTDVYRPYFADYTYVSLGTHTELNLIFVRPVTDTNHTTEEIEDSAYKIDHTEYTGEVNCRTFLQRHNYHHMTTTRYIAEWWPDHDCLCVDLTAPVAAQTY